MYEGYGSCGVAFDVNVNLLDEEALKEELLMLAVKILQSKGIDWHTVGKKLMLKKSIL